MKMYRTFAIVCVFFSVVAAARAQDAAAQVSPVANEYKFLQQFQGEWTSEVEAYLDPTEPPVRSNGTMSGKMIGDYWIVISIEGEFMGTKFQGQGTFGYDAQKKKKYIGTWADSMSDFLWQYEGRVDGNKLILDSQGPDPSKPGAMIKARDTWEFKTPDQLVLTTEMEAANGRWVKVMTSTNNRKQ